jgi:hypothetical protein
LIHGQTAELLLGKTWVTVNLWKDKNSSLKLNCLITHPRLKQTKFWGGKTNSCNTQSEGQTEYQATNRRAGNEY